MVLLKTLKGIGWSLLLGIALALAGCQALEGAVAVTTTIIDENIEHFVDAEDLSTWRAATAAARSLVGGVDTAQEITIGEGMALRTFPMLGRPVQDEMLARYVSLVGKLVALQSDRPSLPYWFAVVENERPIALSLPGGYVFVTTGLLKRLRTESELACILGHEIAHVAERHGMETTVRDRRMASLLKLGSELDADIAEFGEFIDGLYDTLVTNGFDQTYEIKADVAGTRYAYMAGYHPGGLIPFLEASARSQGKVQFEFFKTGSHPDPNARIQAIRKGLASMGDYRNMPTLAGRYRQCALARMK